MGRLISTQLRSGRGEGGRLYPPRMPPPEITPHDRGKALAELERIAQTLNQMSQWLGGAGEQRTAVMLEEALKNVVAAGWLMQRNPATAVEPMHRRAVAALDGRRATGTFDGH